MVQRDGEGNYRDKYIGVIVSHSGGSKPTREEIETVGREEKEDKCARMRKNDAGMILQRLHCALLDFAAGAILRLTKPAPVFYNYSQFIYLSI